MVLFSTLTPNEKSALKEHLENCVVCGAEFIEFQEQQKIISQVKDWSPEINDPVAFTDQIMKTLPRQNKQPQIKNSFLQTLFNWTPLQTGLAACSFILAFTFALEFYPMERPVQERPAIKSGTTLSSNQEELIQAKRSRAARFSMEKIIQQENTFAFSK